MKANYKPKTSYGVNIYDINKNMYMNCAPIAPADLDKFAPKIRDFGASQANDYYMLLCKEISYYTLFCIDCQVKDKFETMVIECVQDIGDIVDIIINEDNIEFWTRKDEEVRCIYLFPYDKGVVKYN